MTQITQEQAPNFEALYCKGIPTDCCNYGVVSRVKGKEVCRVWEEEDARLIADLLNGQAPAPMASREEVATLIEVNYNLLDMSGLNAADAVLELIRKTQERG